MSFSKYYRNTDWYSGDHPQDAMLENAKEKGHRAALVSHDVTKGYRAYASYPHWKEAINYLNPLGPAASHYFEVIVENQPCKPYFDFDYGLLNEQTIDKAIFIQKVQNVLIRVIKKVTTVEDEDAITNSFVWSDSSSTTKLSLHLVVHLETNDTIWATETGMKAGYLTSLMIDDLNYGKELAKFADTKVYTKNRVMRMVGSSKYGKTEKLRLILDENEDNLLRSIITHLPDKKVCLMDIPKDYTPLKSASKIVKEKTFGSVSEEERQYDGVSVFRRLDSSNPPTKVPYTNRLRMKKMTFGNLAQKWDRFLENCLPNGDGDAKKKEKK